MSRVYHLYQVDAFTREKFSGNPAGVITNADGLSVDEMQKIARELNNSETAFVFTSKTAEYEVEVRFFTPTREVPICGHATIAAHFSRAVEKKLESTRVFHKTGVGILPVDILKENDDYRIVMTQGPIEFGPTLEGEILTRLITALNISRDDLRPGCPIQIVSTGHSKVMVPIKKTDHLHRLVPNMDLLTKLSQSINCNGFYIFTLAPSDPETLVHGRMFAPAIGINEDPVTGNANGPLGAYLVHHQLVEHNKALFTFQAIQGEAIKRPGTITVEVTISGREPTEVKISGQAVIAFKSELRLE